MFNVWLSGLNKCSAHESVKLGAKEIDVTSKGLNNVYCESLRITADQTKSSLHPFNQCLRAQPRQEPKSAFDDNVNRRLCTVKFFCNVSLFAWSLITQETAQETNHFNLIIKMSSSWRFLLISPGVLASNIDTLATPCAFPFPFFSVRRLSTIEWLPKEPRSCKGSHMTDNGNEARSEGVILARKR